MNSHSNPTGGVSERKKVEEAMAAAVENSLTVVSDGVYGKFVYEGSHLSPTSMPSFKKYVVTVNSLSKAYAMDGWRIGYIAAPREVKEQMVKVQMYRCACAPLLYRRLLSNPYSYNRASSTMFYANTSVEKKVTSSRLVSLKVPSTILKNFGCKLSFEGSGMRMKREVSSAVVSSSAFGRFGEGSICIF